eukprot:TRINITY_DN9633_c0_g1_i1.p1 TRINITY_DN9633_c0_g1~~TRINITY_DN9633_c0_g1_i1.p1  ORF type:complete len:451 (+),score=65.21 TRINITY_DN9633_c0_g1_i1:57-1409(+)
MHKSVLMSNVAPDFHFQQRLIQPSLLLNSKKQLVANSNIPAEQQRLIYSGHVLKDQQTVQSYGIKDGHTIHLVRGASNTTSAQSTTTSAVGNTSTGGTSPSATPQNQSFPSLPFSMGGNYQQMQQQLLQNPNMMRQLMDNPITQSILNNPELMRSMLLSDPNMRDLIERNPEIGHVLNDPQVLRQSMELMRNPDLMREMMRNTDRAMSNIEMHPEGFNLLRRMYTDVQQPMMDAASNTSSNLTSSNPTNTNNQTGSTANPVQPNTNPLPNPWGGPSPSSTQQPSSQSPQTGANNATSNPNPFNPFSSFSNNPFGSGGMDMGFMNTMLQNPQMRQMLESTMQQMFSNPEMMQSVMNNPMFQSMSQANPMIQNMFSNPELMRQLSNPQTISAILQMQSAMQQLQSTGLFTNLFSGANPSTNQQTGNVPSNPVPNLSNLFSSKPYDPKHVLKS